MGWIIFAGILMVINLYVAIVATTLTTTLLHVILFVAFNISVIHDLVDKRFEKKAEVK